MMLGRSDGVWAVDMFDGSVEEIVGSGDGSAIVAMGCLS